MSHSKNLAPKARPVFPANPTDRDFPPIKNLDAFRLLRPSNDDMVRLLLHDNLDEENFQDDDDDTQHAPLVDGSVVIRSTIPQFGIMGTHGEKARMMDVNNRIFLNTNVPFSAFICGVQGSGKSHTTSCILENCLIPSDSLGKLQKPLSALVFSYGHFSGDGTGFSVSEAAYLGTPHPNSSHKTHVKNINVLVSPSNFLRISKLYSRLPNVTVTRFKLNPRNLDIDIMLKLMNVDESDSTPLYMAQIEKILRDIATTFEAFDYAEFKRRLNEHNFNPAQRNMLDMRLNILESFLDLDGRYPEKLVFIPGEITIMDMSDPFVDANTACIMFRIGLQRYLQSNASGKMIVLDEAHKYMLKIPGAKALNETLLQTIRLQRHYGARVVVSTQEPTLLTDIIALCSMTFIHRFSSPEWLSAVQRHIPVTEQDKGTLMKQIENLKTGAALLYSPGAIFGYNEHRELVTGTQKLVKIVVRKRITNDGGRSIYAV